MEVSAIPLADARGGWRGERDAPALLRMERRSWLLLIVIMTLGSRIEDSSHAMYRTMYQVGK